MTPLQQAAQAAIDILELGDRLSCEREAADDLQKALDAEIAQAVEPCGGCGETNADKRCIGCLHMFANPAQPQAVPETGVEP